MALRLPHPELAGLIRAVRRHVVGARVATVAGAEVRYSVFRSGEDAPDVAFYDEGGAIYVSEDLVDEDGRVADLTAYHEHVEIRHKRAGRSHAYSHRRAYMGSPHERDKIVRYGTANGLSDRNLPRSTCLLCRQR